MMKGCQRMSDYPFWILRYGPSPKGVLDILLCDHLYSTLFQLPRTKQDQLYSILHSPNIAISPQTSPSSPPTTMLLHLKISLLHRHPSKFSFLVLRPPFLHLQPIILKPLVELSKLKEGKKKRLGVETSVHEPVGIRKLSGTALNLE